MAAMMMMSQCVRVRLGADMEFRELDEGGE